MDVYPARILLVDDELNMLKALSGVLAHKGHKVAVAESGQAALDILDRGEFDVAFVDLKMPRMSGIELLERIKEDYPSPHVVIMTGYGTIESAVDAMKKGAYDFILKPFEPEQISLIASQIMQYEASYRQSMSLLREGGERDSGCDGMIGTSSKIMQILDVIERVAKTNASVLIYGESGTGKELVAHAIHNASLRRTESFVKVSCAALSPTIIESELFGHEKGAFTSAYTSRKGRFEMADGGTLFLDEVGDIPPEIQVKLLRVLQEREFERVGGTKTIRVDIRLIAATNRNLLEYVNQEKFREDLFYRLNVVPISIPPLRDRKEDVPLLASEFLKRCSREINKRFRRISRRAMEKLMDYDWPGNVRELENVIERGVVMAQGEVLCPGDLWIGADGLNNSRVNLEFGQETRALNSIEKRIISEVLSETGSNIARSARILKISRGTLYSKIKKHRLEDLCRGFNTL